MKLEIDQEVRKKWGIYKITNIINNNFYIGSTTESFQKRFYKHISDYYKWKNENKRACCPILYNSFAKYGLENFKFEVLFYFNRKKSPEINRKISLYKEEKYIKDLKPKYNIAQSPMKGGCPNLGRKLSDEWKKKIGEKAKLYKHSENLEIYNNKSLQNKELSSLYSVEKDGKIFKGSAIDCTKFLNICSTCLHVKSNKTKYKITQIRSQKKKIKLLINQEWKIFSSYGECDKYLKMWKGYTSTQIVNKNSLVGGFKYELL